MDRKERQRVGMMASVKVGGLNLTEAAEGLGRGAV
jgi:hypothetical protein